MVENKIIIKWDDELGLVSALNSVLTVIYNGRISNDNTQFCYVTTFTETVVYADRTKTETDVFRVGRNGE